MCLEDKGKLQKGQQIDESALLLLFFLQFLSHVPVGILACHSAINFQ